MRGSDERSGALFSYVDLETRVPPAHPLRTIRAVVNAALVGLSPGLHKLYARIGRPSIPLEQLLRADCAQVRERAVFKLEDVERKIAELERLRHALKELIAACPGSGALRACSIMEALAADAEGGASSKALPPATTERRRDSTSKEIA